VAFGATQQFTATVQGAYGPSQQVTWTAVNGTISSNGLYTAPASGTTDTVTATSAADGAVSGTATLALAAQVPPAIASFTAWPASLTYGLGTTLAWNVTGATGLDLTPGIGTLPGTGAGTLSVTPIESTVYKLEATNAFSSSQAQDLVTLFTPSFLAGLPCGCGYLDGTGTAALFDQPEGTAVNASGTVFVADYANSVIRQIGAGGVVSTFAGTPGAAGAVNGNGTSASFSWPMDVALDSSGNLYVADTGNHMIRVVTPGGAVSTLAGNPAMVGTLDGTGTAATFSLPRALAVDAQGNVFVADWGSFTVREITPAGVVTTLAGVPQVQGSQDGLAILGTFGEVSGVAVDASENVYVADSGNNTIRKITPDGMLSTFAGQTGVRGSLDGTGTGAQFNAPAGLAVDTYGNLYVSDAGNGTIRMITPAGVTSTLAGTPGATGPSDGTGASAQFNVPAGLSVDGTGNLYVADAANNAIRLVALGGVVTTLAGLSQGAPGTVNGTGSAAAFSGSTGIGMDGSGNTYVADTASATVRMITPAGVVTTLAGTPGVTGTADATGPAASFTRPSGIATDGSGNVYVSDTYSETIRMIAPGGGVSTFAGTAGQSGSLDGTGASARFWWPSGLAMDATNNLYVADELNATIRKITPGGAVTTVAGTPGIWGYLDGPTNACYFFHPVGVAVDGTGNIYVLDQGNFVIRKVSSAGFVTTLAGTVGQYGHQDGPGASATFGECTSMTLDVVGNLYVVDGNLIRVISPDGQVGTLAGSSGATLNQAQPGEPLLFRSTLQGIVYDPFTAGLRVTLPNGVMVLTPQ
jgi:sugar lactone lactonase YvrE